MNGWVGLRAGRGVAMAIGLLAWSISSVLPAGGCVTSATCVDGWVNEAGECEGLCEPSKCKAGNICVANRCVLPCVDDRDCVYGDSCVPETDDAGDGTGVCRPSKRRAPSVEPSTNTPPGGYGWPCPFGDISCTCPYGDEACSNAALACPNGLECDPNACADCAPDPEVCGDDPHCNRGRCGDGSACTFNTCALAECTPFACQTAGEGDAGAYCTRHDCESDDQCPSGFYCGNTRDPHDICGATCTAGGVCSDDDMRTCVDDGDCQKGNNALCGETDEPCLDVTTSTTHFEGGLCAMRRTCLKRDDCVRCERNSDCRLGEGEVCGTHAGQDVCLRLCADPGDCKVDETCVAYVPAGEGLALGATCASAPHVNCETEADCPTAGDTCETRSVCAPTHGACDASDSASKFCRHCVDDEDCGGKDKPGRWACVEVGGGEFACLDRDFSTRCTRNEDCPIAPSGRHGECLDTEVPEDSPVHNRCFAPFCPEFSSCPPELRGRYTCQ